MNKKRKYRLRDILKSLEGKYKVIGKGANRRFDKLRPITEADSTSLSFLAGNNPSLQILGEDTKAAFIICEPFLSITKKMKSSGCFIQVEHAKQAFVRVGNILFPAVREWGIHPSAIVKRGASIPERCCIGPFSYIGDQVRIGPGTVIDANCYFYDNTKIEIGKDCLIQSGVTIGTDGFGYIAMADWGYENFPQVGGVILQDNVHIHAHVNVDRGTLGDTKIGRGTKVDKFCHIGHNVTVGQNCIICAKTLIAGSAFIGDQVWIAPSVTIRDGGVKIGSNSFIGIGSLVVKDIASDSMVMGAPAKPVEEYKKFLQAIRKIIRAEKKTSYRDIEGTSKVPQ